VTATVLLIRHAAHGQLGTVLSGRTPGLALSHEGRRQAHRLARRLAGERLDKLHASPVQRAGETAAEIARSQLGVVTDEVAALDEIDFGRWEGTTFGALADDPQWQRWNAERHSAAAPGGESMIAAQARAWDHIAVTAAASPGATIAMVSHCDIIRGVVVRVLGLTLDAVHRFDVDVASVTRIAVGGWGSRLIALNERCP
jgi:ribonuclease H / adenosylcobalamin/alpha-ribazole phosphatase